MTRPAICGVFRRTARQGNTLLQLARHADRRGPERRPDVAPETVTVIIDPACEYWLERTDDDPGEDEPTD